MFILILHPFLKDTPYVLKKFKSKRLKGKQSGKWSPTEHGRSIMVTRQYFLHAPPLSEWIFSLGIDIHTLVTILIAATRCLTETTFETLTQKASQGQHQGSAGRGDCHQAWWPGFKPHDLCGRGREPIAPSCYRTSTHALYHVHTPTHIQAYIHTSHRPLRIFSI